VKARTVMTCREAIEFIAEYLDGALPVPVRTEFERHLAVCPSCEAYLDGYRRTVAMGRAAFAELQGPTGGTLPEGLVRAICAAQEKRGSG